MNSLQQALTDNFGYSSFLKGQQEVMNMLLSGRSAAAVFPTGAGKSLCYQLPALMLEGVTIVVSPLIALMKDQIDDLKSRGIAAQRLDSTLSEDEYREVMRQMRAGELKLLYVSPERFNNERFRESIISLRVSLFAVDEAHCISQWGHNFRPDYLKLPTFASLCRAERVLALTATASSAVLADICKSFAIDQQCTFRTGVYRENLTIETTAVGQMNRDQFLLEQIQHRPNGSIIVYVTLQKTAARIAKLLSASGRQARAYHAGLKDEIRESVQDWFTQSTDAIVVATIAFGMGIDKSDIRYIYHYNLPKSLENYSQEIGRAGRDGQPATCHLLACANDLSVLENFIYGDTPKRKSVGIFVECAFAGTERVDIGYYDVSARSDIRILVVRTLFTYLELLGYLEAETPYYSAFQFQPKMPSAEILDHFDQQRRTFLTSVLRHAHKARTWFNIDVKDVAIRIKEDRQRIVRALEHLHEQNFIVLRSSGVRFPYKILQHPTSTEELADELFQMMREREQRDVDRLQQVIQWVTAAECQVQLLCAYFDAPIEKPCGHCSFCRLQQSITLEGRENMEVDASLLCDILLLCDQHEAIDDPVTLARVLCGLTSPKLSQAKLGRHALFGRFTDVPYAKVLEFCEEHTPLE